eukprot:5465405-Amphidinium_carterae.1
MFLVAVSFRFWPTPWAERSTFGCLAGVSCKQLLVIVAGPLMRTAITKPDWLELIHLVASSSSVIEDEMRDKPDLSFTSMCPMMQSV